MRFGWVFGILARAIELRAFVESRSAGIVLAHFFVSKDADALSPLAIGKARGALILRRSAASTRRRLLARIGRASSLDANLAPRRTEIVLIPAIADRRGRAVALTVAAATLGPRAGSASEQAAALDAITVVAEKRRRVALGIRIGAEKLRVELARRGGDALDCRQSHRDGGRTGGS